MRKALAVFLFASLGFASQTLASTIEPIPGSLIYPTQPRTKLMKAPIGSLLTHEFRRDGATYSETYRIGPDRELQLLGRKQLSGTR